jgi:hypothetical protein
MSRQSSHTLSLDCVPHLTVKVIVSGKEQAARVREAERRDSTEDALVAVRNQFFISTEIKESARGIIRARRKGLAIREESKEVC